VVAVSKNFLFSFWLDVRPYNYLAANAAQLQCMQSVPSVTLENAVETAGNDFLPVQDGI
jgi:hypothetical protein